jgi:8-oxo-dGTP pyrophosphatase MutT (NUDIX family)
MKVGQIRPLAIGIFRRKDQILVFEGVDSAIGARFYRPLGGAIEFGEYGHQALVREIREEIGVEAKDLHFLGVSENIFEYLGDRWHEIVLVYEGTLADGAIYEQDAIAGHEDDGTPFPVLWKSLAEFRNGAAILYPDGLLGILAGRKSIVGQEKDPVSVSEGAAAQVDVVDHPPGAQLRPIANLRPGTYHQLDSPNS